MWCIQAAIEQLFMNSIIFPTNAKYPLEGRKGIRRQRTQYCRTVLELWTMTELAVI